jgi:hypothetical protein
MDCVSASVSQSVCLSVCLSVSHSVSQNSVHVSLRNPEMTMQFWRMESDTNEVRTFQLWLLLMFFSLSEISYCLSIRFSLIYTGVSLGLTT